MIVDGITQMSAPLLRRSKYAAQPLGRCVCSGNAVTTKLPRVQPHQNRSAAPTLDGTGDPADATVKGSTNGRGRRGL